MRWTEVFKERGALWISDGNPSRPHALLSFKMHSNGFFNGRKIITDEPLLQEAIANLVDQFILKGGDIKRVNRVVGPQTSGRKLAEFIADEISGRRGKMCYWASPTNSNWGGTRAMVFEDADHTVRPGENILLCDDVINTGGSIELTAKACEETGGVILPQLLCLVNRSGRQGVFGRLIVSLVDYPMPAWAASGCEMCRTGSEAIPPKGTRTIFLFNASAKEYANVVFPVPTKPTNNRIGARNSLKSP